MSSPDADDHAGPVDPGGERSPLDLVDEELPFVVFVPTWPHER